ncbi:hypothetical protein ACFE04_025198 [Oxalis oulophora]
MAQTTKIIRKSIYTFLQNYHHFTSTGALLAFPSSAAILLSQSYPPLLPTIYLRLNSLFQASGFPPSSLFFYFLNLKLSQTISSSILTFPFAITFLLLAKSCIIRTLKNPKPSSLPSIFTIFSHLYSTYLTNSLLILSANATSFAIIFFAFTFLEGLGFSSPDFFLLSVSVAVVYSVLLSNVLVICNLALVLSGMENSGGYLSILKAFFLIRGRTLTALALAVPVNLSLAAIEALFQFRVVRAYNYAGKASYSMALEGMFIAYLYSIFLVLETVVSCIFFKSCCKQISCFDQEIRYAYKIEIAEEYLEQMIKEVKIVES